MSNVIDRREHFRLTQLYRAWSIRVAREPRRRHAVMPPPDWCFGDLSPDDILRVPQPVTPADPGTLNPDVGLEHRRLKSTKENDDGQE